MRMRLVNSMIEKNENETSEFNDRKKMRMRLLIEENRNGTDRREQE